MSHKSLVAVLLTFFVYVSEGGSVSFTDEATRVPERYQRRAQPIEPAALECYRKFSASDKVAQAIAAGCVDPEKNQVRDALGW